VGGLAGGRSEGGMTDWTQVRKQFPSLEKWTYLNTATYGQHPLRAEQAIIDHLAHRTEEACYDFLDWFVDHDHLRAEISQLVNCEPEDVAYFPNSSTALGLLLNGVDFDSGDEVLTIEGEFPNQVYAPLAHGAVLTEAPGERLLDALTVRTRLVVVSSVNYVTGYRVPLEPLAEECRRRGILLYVDATQSAGALKTDFAALQPSMLAVNAYKWMCCPSGIGFAAIHPELRRRMRPLTVGWRSDKGWRNVANLSHGAPEFAESADRYEGGMLPSPLLYALKECVRMFPELGPADVEARVLGLARRLRERMREMGLEPLSYEDSAIVAVPVADAPGVAAELRKQRVLVSARHGLLRVSPHFYNNEADLERLMKAMGELVRS